MDLWRERDFEHTENVAGRLTQYPPHVRDQEAQQFLALVGVHVFDEGCLVLPENINRAKALTAGRYTCLLVCLLAKKRSGPADAEMHYSRRLQSGAQFDHGSAILVFVALGATKHDCHFKLQIEGDYLMKTVVAHT